MTLVVIIYGAGFRLYKIAAMTNDLSWLMYGFTWKGTTTGLARRTAKAESKFLTHFLTEVRLHYRLEIDWHLPIHLTSQASLTFQPLTFDLFPFCPYVFRLMNAFFPPPRQLLVSVHFRAVWQSASETCSRKVIHHNGRLFIFILCRC